MRPYEIIEHTADIGLKANGRTLKELFENAAKGMFEIIGGERATRVQDGQGYKVASEEHKRIEIKKDVEGLEELLVDWLSELLYIFNKENIFFRSFKILELNNTGLIGESSGDKIEVDRPTLQTEIKAITFHDLKIEENKNGFHCNIIFDV